MTTVMKTHTIDQTTAMLGECPYPFALLIRADNMNAAAGTCVAKREPGTPVRDGELTICGNKISFSGAPDSALFTAHMQALARAITRLPEELDGTYPIRWYAEHRALVEANADYIAIDTLVPDDSLFDVLALAWIGTLLVKQGRTPRQALAKVVDIYRAQPAAAQSAMQQALAGSPLDAGGLFAIYLERSRRESDAEEQVRWQSWFLGQRVVDLPYNRRAVIDIFDADIDPDLKRLHFHEVIRHYTQEIERGNIARIVNAVRQQRQQLIFGRMSRAFHNQSLLFANAGYLQMTEAAREPLAALVAGCTGLQALAPHVDRLRTMLQGGSETALTAALGAVELLEDAILDDQRKMIDGILKAGREGGAGSLTARDVFARTERLLDQCEALRAAMHASPCRPAAYVILSQRLAPLETHLLARINELQEPYLGKPENLKALVRRGGSRFYSSSDYAWLQHADHWVEAIPLFIKERVLVVDGVEVTETVIDQQAMEETFREQFADHWAINCDNVMDSEHLALAREMIAKVDPRFTDAESVRLAVQDDPELATAVGAGAAMAWYAYRHFAELFHQRVEKEGISRYDVMLSQLMDNLKNDHPQCLYAEACRRMQANGTTIVTELTHIAATLDEKVQADTARLTPLAHLPRRPQPALHVLTTQSARMSDSYVRTWLEESMALFNVIRAHGLDGEVHECMAGYRRLVGALGAKLIRELGMWAEVEELMALEGIDEGPAVARIVAGNPAISRQLSTLAVLGEHFTQSPETEAPLVEQLLKMQASELRERALQAVFERNELELLPRLEAYREAHPAASEIDILRALILDNSDYADDLAAFTRFAAREEAVRVLDEQDSVLCLDAAVRDWLRNHTRLALTTARRETLLAHELNRLTLHPLYYYRAAGANKRFHQLYTPSRVDLGTHERESVEKWSQWVGGADIEASRVGRRLYGLINKNVKMFGSLTEPEVIKTGENASMVAHFAYSNAMSLLINSVGRGDIEDIGDQMSRRKDRYIHPGGEGYGGYCVPKDGLFLDFVLVLTRAVKLRQLGIPDALHAGVVAFAEFLLRKRVEFGTEIEWEAWAMQLLAERTELSGFFSLREGDDCPVPVFQITRIARALTQLGRPELNESRDVLANLAAHWGIYKVIVGGEQVNRFMPFYKTWMTYHALLDAAKLNPQAGIRTRDFTVVLSAEYKPDTQDGRFSVGMRKYELFAGTGEHLTYSLDVQGQDLVHLMFRGFDHLWQHRDDARLGARLGRLLKEMAISVDDGESIARLRALFPGFAPPAEIRMVSPMKLTTSDLLHYASDTQLEQLANEAQRRLVDVGLTENEIAANMQVHGPRLARWTRLRDFPSERLQALIDYIGGNIHALALSIQGPAGNYEMAVQGADVLDAGIPNSDLLALLANPVKTRELMLAGNPHSALVIMDGTSGARRRALNRLAVMRWFAAGEAIGRQAIYRCVGIGADTVESWRADMRHQRERARLLFEALASGQYELATERYANIVEELRETQETALLLEDEERMLRFGKLTAQEEATARAVADVTAGLALSGLDFAGWLALGGQFWLMGEAPGRIAEVRMAFERAIDALDGKASVADEAAVEVLCCSQYLPAVEEFREEKGVESSNKATEEVAAVAIDTRKRLAERAARARALRERLQAFRAKMAANTEGLTLETLIASAHEVRGDGTTVTQAQYGRLQALTRLAFLALGQEIFADEPALLDQLTEHTEALFTGRELDPLALRTVSGGYEDPGDIARLAGRVAECCNAGQMSEVERDRLLVQMADVAVLFDCCRALELTIDFFTVTPEAPAVWRVLADFFAESLNDHFYEYRPWVFSRGIGFAHLEGEALYDFATAHYRWLYCYLRGVALQFTELNALSADELGHLLGDMETADALPPIGADGDPAERRWRAYCQLRELAFVRNDGFPLPAVFPSFDPALIRAEERTNLVFLYPVGRTHVSRALMEGPTLTAEITAQGRPGVNLLITRDGQVAEGAANRPVLQITNAHVYISREEYIAALMRHRGLSLADAEAQAARDCGPKGVRIAARFTRPVTVALVFPFHGHPKYDSGLLEELGLPYSCQSLFHTWTTYDKAKYPAIFAPETGVNLPGEIDWLADYTAELGEASRQAIEHGDAARNFAGLRAFAKRYPRVMVKDAAESGGRSQKAFTLRHGDGTLDEEAITEAVEFIYQISLQHNVAIQEVVISSPEYWATEAFMQSFVDRQIQEWGVAVNRMRRPRTPLFGSHRLIFSTPDPRGGEWHISHPITLNSRQLITNVGRGGTLEIFKPEQVRPEFRAQLPARLQEAGRKVMAALARYGEIAAEDYQRETGREIGADATGLSYAIPRYMMLDFIVQPLFAEDGTLIDIERNGDDVRFILQQGEKRITGTVTDWRVVQIEPNIGIGLWDRVALREIAHSDGDWQAVGTNARIVLADLAKAGEEYLGVVMQSVK